MSEVKDPAIKLFGKTIPLPEISATAAAEGGGAHLTTCSDFPGDDGPTQGHPSSPNSSHDEDSMSRAGEEQDPEKDQPERKLIDPKDEGGTQPLTSEQLPDRYATSATQKNSEISASDDDNAAVKSMETGEEQNETSNSQEKTLKKPDKILPCPRCNSMDTKFCYYNNYNVNQPRHFCKNCQRYWTAGGTMRNVPVGAGRRKNKHSASHYRHISVSEALQNPRADIPNGLHHPTLQPNVGENGEDHSSGSSVTAASSMDEVGKTVLPDPMMPNCQSFPPQGPCFTGPPWPYPWNSAQWSSPVSSPAFYPAGFPMPFYPAAPYWGCTVPGTWNLTWVTQPPMSQNQMAPPPGPNSPSLGKHSREYDMLKSTNEHKEGPQKESDPEKCLWVPKTLRIEDPGEAARSSIWATLGIKHDTADSIRGGGLFKAFQSNGDKKNHTETSTVLQANPAALSRSLDFHESA
ncbi:unnamed protein product [Ilex paraguariensis]|uniref:Dof-type domain-containing protein n=1 Tax=Ilex paraguariensis TaxID=185542 RepID=A0ABC8RHJ1_9AQUA